jgi:hypothetical protein
MNLTLPETREEANMIIITNLVDVQSCLLGCTAV